MLRNLPMGLTWLLPGLAFFACNERTDRADSVGRTVSGTPSPVAETAAPSPMAETTANRSQPDTPQTFTNADVGEWCEKHFQGEPIDPEWAAARELLIREVIDQSPETKTQTVECRTTLCKVKVGFGTSAAQEGFYPTFLDVNGPLYTRVATASFAYPLASVENTSVLWISKPGCSFPGPSGETFPCIEEPAPTPDNGSAQVVAEGGAETP
jgi:hypothetical protein